MKNLALLILAIIGFFVGVITTVFALSIIMETTTIVSSGINLRGYRIASLLCMCGFITSFRSLWQMFFRLSILK